MPRFCWLSSLILVICWFPHAVHADWGDDQYALAADHYRNGRWEQAIGAFEKLVGQEPDHPRVPLAHFFLGESRIQVQQYDDCVEHFSQFVDQVAKHPLRTRALFRRAEANYLIGQDADAIKQLESLIDDPQARNYLEYAWVYLGEMYQRLPGLENRNQARHYFEQALAKYPASSLSNRCRLGLAQVFQVDGQYEEADRFLAFLIEAQDPVITREAQVIRASLLVEMQQWDAARELLDDETIQELPITLQAKAHYWRGRAELGAQRWSSAAHFLELAFASLKEEKLAEAAIYDCSIALWREGDWHGAQEMLQRSVQRWPTGRWAAEARFLRIQAAMESGDTTTIPSLVNDFVNHHPNHPLWNRVLEAEGRAAFAREDYRQSVKSFRQLVAKVEAESDSSDKQWLASWCYMLAVSQLADSDYPDGLKSIDKCLAELERNQPDRAAAATLHQNALFAKSTALMKLQRYDDASEIQASWLETYPDSPLWHVVKSDQFQCRIELQRWEELEQDRVWVEDSLASSESNTRDGERRTKRLTAGCLQIARHYYDQNEHSQAQPWFQWAARSSDPTVQQQAESGLAWTIYKTASGAEQERAFQALRDRFPDSELTADAALKQAETLIKRSDLDQARDLLRDLCDRNNDWSHRHLALSMLARITVKDHSRASQRAAARLLQQAIEQYQRVAKELKDQDPETLATYRYDLAWLQLDLDNAPEALSLFRQINLNHPTSRYWADATFRVAQQYFDQDKNQMAADVLQQLLDCSESADSERSGLVSADLIAHVHFQLAMIAVKQDQWDLTERHCESLCRQFPDHALRWNAEYWRAEAKYRAGDYLAAISMLQAIAERTIGRLDPWVAMAQLRLAQSLGQRDRWDEARTTAEMAKERFPDFRQLFELDYLIGRSLAQEARFEDARAAYQNVIDSPVGKRTETAAMAQWMIGETYFHQEQYSLAAEAYHRTQTLYPYPQWQAAGLLQAGKCYEHLKQESDAISIYRQLLRDFPEATLAEQARRRLARMIEQQNLTATGQRNPNR